MYIRIAAELCSGLVFWKPIYEIKVMWRLPEKKGITIDRQRYKKKKRKNYRHIKNIFNNEMVFYIHQTQFVTFTKALPQNALEYTTSTDLSKIQHLTSQILLQARTHNHSSKPNTPTQTQAAAAGEEHTITPMQTSGKNTFIQKKSWLCTKVRNEPVEQRTKKKTNN